MESMQISELYSRHSYFFTDSFRDEVIQVLCCKAGNFDSSLAIHPDHVLRLLQSDSKVNNLSERLKCDEVKVITRDKVFHFFTQTQRCFVYPISVTDTFNSAILSSSWNESLYLHAARKRNSLIKSFYENKGFLSAVKFLSLHLFNLLADEIKNKPLSNSYEVNVNLNKIDDARDLLYIINDTPHTSKTTLMEAASLLLSNESTRVTFNEDEPAILKVTFNVDNNKLVQYFEFDQEQVALKKHAQGHNTFRSNRY